jgi:hypothetical protein
LDRQGQLIALGAALVCLAVSALAREPVAIRELGWLSGEGRLDALTSEPQFDREAVFAAAARSPLAAQYPTPEQLSADLLVGEALFKTPLLLGGQAAKAGISCHSCHVNGRGNPHFRFPAISGAPGTADTTHSFFSKTLGNGVFDPVPIPDLARAGKVSHDPATRELEGFIGTIVVDEFSGSAPMNGVIEPLAIFVRALRLTGETAPEALQPRLATSDMADAAMMIAQARRQWSGGNGALASLLLAGARERLAVINARLIPGEHDPAAAALVALSRQLGKVQGRLREDQAGAQHFDEALAALRLADRAIADLSLQGRATLYDRATLERALGE